MDEKDIEIAALKKALELVNDRVTTLESEVEYVLEQLEKVDDLKNSSNQIHTKRMQLYKKRLLK